MNNNIIPQTFSYEVNIEEDGTKFYTSDPMNDDQARELFCLLSENPTVKDLTHRDCRHSIKSYLTWRGVKAVPEYDLESLRDCLRDDEGFSSDQIDEIISQMAVAA